MPANVLLNSVLHEVLFGVLFNTSYSQNHVLVGVYLQYAINVIIMALEIDQTWKTENFIDNDDAHDATRSEILPYRSTSIYVNMAASVQLRTNKPNYELKAMRL